MKADMTTALNQMKEAQEFGDMNFDYLVALLVGMSKDSQRAGRIGNEIIRRHKDTASMGLLSAVRNGQ